MSQSEYVKREEFERAKGDLHSRINKTNLRVEEVDKERIKDKGELSVLIKLLSQSMDSINENTKKMADGLEEFTDEFRENSTETSKRIDTLENRTKAIEENKNHINSIVIAVLVAGIPAMVSIVKWLGPLFFPTIN